MGRWSTIVGVAISIGTAYLVMQFLSIMDYVQALFSFFIAPLFGTVMLGMLWKRATAAGGFWGLLCGNGFLDRHVGVGENGSVSAPLCRVVAATRETWLRICTAPCGPGWFASIVTVVVSLLTKPKPDSELKGLVYGDTEIPSEGQSALYQRPDVLGRRWSRSCLLMLNILFW